MQRIAVITALGALGTLVRLLVGDAFARHGEPALPWATFSINLTGSFLLGVVYALTPSDLAPLWRSAIGIGCLGAFTTFSTMMWETMQLVDDGKALHGAAYVMASVMIGLGAMVAGTAAGRAL